MKEQFVEKIRRRMETPFFLWSLLLSESANSNVEEDFLRAERFLIFDQNQNRPKKIIARLAKKGNAPAQRMLANYYFFVSKVPSSNAKAIKWYREAARRGDISSCRILAYLHCSVNWKTRDRLRFNCNPSKMQAAKWTIVYDFLKERTEDFFDDLAYDIHRQGVDKDSDPLTSLELMDIFLSKKARKLAKRFLVDNKLATSKEIAMNWE